MDDIDVKILEELKKNGRATASDVSKAISLSVPATAERIRKMETSGLIRQYTLLLDPRQEASLAAFINIRLEHPKFYEGFVEAVKAHGSVSECYYVAGEFDFILKAVITGEQTLERVLNDVKSIPGVSLTRTSVVLSTNKREICTLPAEE